MRRVAVLLLILGLAGRVSTAQAAPDSTTVPMEVREGRAIVQVMLQGRGPYRLAVRVGPFVGVPVNLAGVMETGVIDTQGRMMIQALPDVAKWLTFERPPTVVGRARVGGGPPIELREGRLAGDVRIGAQIIPRPRIAVHPLPPDIPSRVTIGIGVLAG